MSLKYPFARQFGNIKIALLGMECTGKLPHGCPNCQGLDFCTKKDALKQYEELRVRYEKLERSLGDLLEQIECLDGIEYTKDLEPYKAEAVWDDVIRQAQDVLSSQASLR